MYKSWIAIQLSKLHRVVMCLDKRLASLYSFDLDNE